MQTFYIIIECPSQCGSLDSPQVRTTPEMVELEYFVPHKTVWKGCEEYLHVLDQAMEPVVHIPRPVQVSRWGILRFFVAWRGGKWYLLLYLIVTFHRPKEGQIFATILLLSGHGVYVSVATSSVLCRSQLRNAIWLTQRKLGLIIWRYLRTLGKWERSIMLQPGVKSCLELFNCSWCCLCPWFFLPWRMSVIGEIYSQTMFILHLPLNRCTILI